jgi:hypothetical protein
MPQRFDQGIDELLIMCLGQKGDESLLLPPFVLDIGVPFVLDINVLPTRWKKARLFHLCSTLLSCGVAVLGQLGRNSDRPCSTQGAVLSVQILV